MVAVSTTDGIAYGLRLMASFGLLLLVAFGCVLAGTNLVTGAYGVGLYGRQVTSWGELIAGAALTLVGILGAYGGSFGLLFKVVADGVRRGNSRAV